VIKFQEIGTFVRFGSRLKLAPEETYKRNSYRGVKYLRNNTRTFLLQLANTPVRNEFKGLQYRFIFLAPRR